jgi:hypothetical protein
MIRLLIAAFSLLGIVTLVTPIQAEDKIEYNRDIRPILSDNCFRCHGPDSASRKANLRLDKRENAIELEAIVPKKPAESELIARIETHERDQVMPPPKSQKKLTPAQKNLLNQWIAQGAEYQPHWSFIAPKKSAFPIVKDTDWAKTPVDKFILAELERRGLKPAAEADRRTLARRLSLDLTGLPPTPSDVEAFVNDKSTNAYEKLVDKYLASPQWGEHRARYWLDLARYADTHGIHFDNYREMWAYRDWVINAFNRNMPFDQFTIEQIAGDLLPNHTLDQEIASGFNRCNITTSEGGAIDEEYLVLYNRDRTETVSQVFMGLTAGCAVCHDHKFDPLTQKEFYSMAAFFNNTTQNAMDGNIKDTPPKLFVPAPADRPRWAAISKEVESVRKEIETRKQASKVDFNKFLTSSTPQTVSALIPNKDQRFQANIDSKDATSVPKRNSGAALELADVGDFERDQSFSYGAWIKIAKRGISGSVIARMDDQHDFRGWDLWLEGNKVGAHLVNKWPENALKAVTTSEVPHNTWTHVFVTYDGSSKASGVKIYFDGKLQPTAAATDALKSTIRTTVPLKVGQRHSTARTLDGAIIHDVRTYNCLMTSDDVDMLAGGTRLLDLVEKPVDKRLAPDIDTVFTWWVNHYDGPAKELRGKLAKVESEEAAIKSRGTIALVMNEKPQPPMAFILFRGDYDKRREQVKPATPAILPAYPSDLPQNRLGFAKWLLRPEHPLTARVTVNHFWQELFGTGIVKTAGDFGASGELPSHPELIDWLAVEFRDQGWNIKAFFKMLVMSAAYRQTEAASQLALEKDPANRLLTRGPRYRMDAEMVRDYALSTSGLLINKIGGPSVKPYMPGGVWEAVAMIGSNTRDYKADAGENLYRRSLYTFWKRSAPPAQMEIFNAPSREFCAVRRDRTNTPLQALVTLNDTQFVEAARRLAELTLKAGGDTTDAKLDFIAKRLLARSVRPEESKIVKESLEGLLNHYKAHVDEAKKLIAVGESKSDPKLDASSLAAWTMLCNELLNLDEVLNK